MSKVFTKKGFDPKKWKHFADTAKRFPHHGSIWEHSDIVVVANEIDRLTGLVQRLSVGKLEIVE